MGRTAQIAAATAASLAAVGGGTALAAAPHASAGVKHFVETEAGTQLSVTGNNFEDVFKIKRGPFGYGSAIRDATLTGDAFPASGKVTATSWYKDGRLTANETIKLDAPLVDGVGQVSGTGTCQSGTFKHQGETCTYAIKGSYDLATGRMFLTLTGTYTPSSTATTPHK